MTDDAPARRRPTLTELRGLEEDLALARRTITREQDQTRDALQKADEALAARDEAIRRWESMDPQARTLGQVLPLLDELHSVLMGDQWGLDGPSLVELHRAAADAMVPVLAYLGARYGIDLRKADDQ